MEGHRYYTRYVKERERETFKYTRKKILEKKKETTYYSEIEHDRVMGEVK